MNHVTKSEVQRTADGKPTGVVSVCTCGWRSGQHVTGMSASLAGRDHCEQAEQKKAK